MLPLLSDLLRLLPTLLAPLTLGWGVILFVRGFRRPRVMLDEHGNDRQPRWAAFVGAHTSGKMSLWFGPLLLLLGVTLVALSIGYFPSNQPRAAGPSSPYIFETGWPLAMAISCQLLALSVLAHALWSRRAWGVPRCQRCGYPMAGMPSTICPECGRDHLKPKQLLKPRLNKLALVAAILIAVLSPFLFSAKSIHDRYLTTGVYGLIPDRVLIAGMWYLPEDLILGTALLPQGDVSPGSLTYRLWGEGWPMPQGGLAEKTLPRIVAVLENPESSTSRRWRAISLMDTITPFDGKEVWPEEFKRERVVRGIGRTVIDLLLEDASTSQHAFPSSAWMVDLSSIAWQPAIVATDTELREIATLAGTDSFPFAVAAGYILLEAMDRRDVFADLVVHAMTDAGSPPSEQNRWIATIAGKIAAQDENFLESLLQLTFSSSVSERARAAMALTLWDFHPTQGSGEYPQYVSDRLYEMLDDPSLLVVSKVLESHCKMDWSETEWVDRVANRVFSEIYEMNPKELAPPLDAALKGILRSLSEAAALRTDRHLQSLVFLHAQALTLDLYGSTYDQHTMRILQRHDDASVRALANLYFNTILGTDSDTNTLAQFFKILSPSANWETVPDRPGDWLPQAIEKALREAEDPVQPSADPD